MPNIDEKLYLTFGEGGIDPQARVAAGETTQTDLDRLHEFLLTHEAYDDLDPQLALFPGQCVDGRGIDTLGANAAGGTFSIVMGDALSNQAYRPSETSTAPEHAVVVYEEVQKRGGRIGTHNDVHKHGPNCGCGAQDRLNGDEAQEQKSFILPFITRRHTEIKNFLTGLRYTQTGDLVGVEIPDETDKLVASRAQELISEDYATDGVALEQASVMVAGEESVATLGEKHPHHLEAALVIDTRPNKTLNRKKIEELFGGNLQAFYVNVASLASGADKMSISPQDMHQRLIASLYYNVATAGVLGGPGLEIIVL